MTLRDKAILAFVIWLAVYPSVLLMTWLIGRLSYDPPLPLQVLISTAFTVPFIEFVVLRRAKRAAAHAEEELDIDGELRSQFGEGNG